MTKDKKLDIYMPVEYEDEYFIGLEEPAAEPKKYNSFFDNFDKLVFTTDDPNLSQHIDDILYGKV